jgi:uncharacterized membrane protein YuzA (DUF378 family)
VSAGHDRGHEYPRGLSTMRNPYDTIGRIGLLLAVVGAANWLLVGLFEWNLVQWIFTDSGTQTVSSLGERVVYIVVGVGGVLAIPMLAATLSRARGRDVRSDESYASGHSRSRLQEDDAAFYMGAPKEAHAEDRSEVAASSAEGRTTEQSGPVRKTERVIVRTEEPIIGSTETTTSSESFSEEPGTTHDRDLQYGSGPETDDDLGEERRRAA